VLIAVASFKGSPGVTSLALGLAARWPTPGAVLVEADPAGGDLAFRFGHRREPGLSDLATDTRSGTQEPDLTAYAQRLVLGCDVVFAPADQIQRDTPEPRAGEEETGEAVQAVRMVARNGLGVLHRAAADRLVVVDVGRLGWSSPAWPIVSAADVLLLLSRPGLDAVDAVQVRRDRLLGMPGMGASVRLVLAGQPAYPGREIADTVGLPLAGKLPEDRRGAAVLGGRSRAGWGWTRLELLRAARSIGLHLHTEAQDRAMTDRHLMHGVLTGRRHPDQVAQVSRS
jgi:hypothetical protein